jgi:hypothetical protein
MECVGSSIQPDVSPLPKYFCQILRIYIRKPEIYSQNIRDTYAAKQWYYKLNGELNNNDPNVRCILPFMELS